MKAAIIACGVFIGISGIFLFYFFTHGSVVTFDLNRDYIDPTASQTNYQCAEKRAAFNTRAKPLQQQVLAIQAEYNQYAFTTGHNNDPTINAMYAQYFDTEDEINSLQQSLEKGC